MHKEKDVPTDQLSLGPTVIEVSLLPKAVGELVRNLTHTYIIHPLSPGEPVRAAETPATAPATRAAAATPAIAELHTNCCCCPQPTHVLTRPCTHGLL